MNRRRRPRDASLVERGEIFDQEHTPIGERRPERRALPPRKAERLRETPVARVLDAMCLDTRDGSRALGDKALDDLRRPRARRVVSPGPTLSCGPADRPASAGSGPTIPSGRAAQIPTVFGGCRQQPKGSTAAILYPISAPGAREALLEIRDPVSGGVRGYVALRPVVLPTLLDLLRNRQDHACRALAQELAFGTGAAAQALAGSPRGA
jgi:hypothetical protein